MLEGLDPKVALIVLAVNIGLSAVAGILTLFAKPDTKLGKVAGWIQKVVDFVSANRAHK